MQPTFLEVKPLNSNQDNNHKAKKLAVLLHGVGSDAKDLISIVPYINQSLPDVHFLALNGLQKYDLASFGFQWFSLQNRDQKAMQEGVKQTVPLVVEFLEQKLRELELNFEDLFLIGFSQGTMLATHIATSFKEKLAGIVGFAGTIIPNPNFTGNIHTPICFIHGSEDEVLKVDLMRQSAQHLKEIGFNVETYEIPFLTHSIDMKCIQIAIKFIKNNYES
jgi:phospholipase/carboxylesterase